MQNKVYRAGFTKGPPPHPQHFSIAMSSVDQAVFELRSTCPCLPSVGIKGIQPPRRAWYYFLCDFYYFFFETILLHSPGGQSSCLRLPHAVITSVYYILGLIILHVLISTYNSFTYSLYELTLCT